VFKGAILGRNRRGANVDKRAAEGVPSMPIAQAQSEIFSQEEGNEEIWL
jgi:hypothetical protein